MGYSSLISLLPLYYLLPLIAGQQQPLEIDVNGVFHYSQDAELQHLPVCFIADQDLHECSAGEQPTISLKTVKVDETIYRRKVTVRPGKNPRVQEIVIMWPQMIYEPQGQGSYYNPYPTSWPSFVEDYWMVNPVYTITANGKTYLLTNDVSKWRPFYRSAKGRNSKKEATLEVIPFNVSGCLPVNNTICEEDQIERYQEYLKELKATLGRSEGSKVVNGSSAQAESEVEEDEESYTEENEESETGEEVESQTENEIEDSSSSQIATQEFADKIGESVARHLKKVTTGRCPVTVRSLDVIVNQEENCKPKLESVDVELEKNVTNKPVSSARSRLHYKAGQKRFRINL